MAALLLKVTCLAAVLFLSISIAAAVSGVAAAAQNAGPGPGPAPSATAQAASLFLFCAVVAATFSWLILRSSAWGSRLVVTVFLAYFGLGTLLPQIESLIFLPRHLPPDLVGRLFVMGAIAGSLFAPGAVLILGRLRRPAETTDAAATEGRRTLEWVRKTALLALVYVAVYFLAGYFIAFRSPDVLAYYDDTDPGSFWAQIAKVWTVAPWLFAVQALRGVLLVAFVVPVILSFRGGRLELALLTGSLFAIWSLMLLSPNPFMPRSVRMAHFFETVPSNFLFGALVGTLYRIPR